MLRARGLTFHGPAPDGRRGATGPPPGTGR